MRTRKERPFVHLVLVGHTEYYDTHTHWHGRVRVGARSVRPVTMFFKMCGYKNSRFSKVAERRV